MFRRVYLIIVVLVLVPVSGQASDNLGARLKLLLADSAKHSHWAQYRTTEGRIPVFIKVKAHEDVAPVEAVIVAGGGTIQSRVGMLMTGLLHSRQIDGLSKRAEITKLSLSPRVHLRNDVGTAVTQADTVKSGNTERLPQAYKGQGVIAGVIDSGIDYAHPDFRDSDGESRVHSIWDQTTNGTAPSGFDYGNECQKASILDNSCTQIDDDGHGTHVSGTVAGSDKVYAGMAPEAEIVFVKIDTDDDDSGTFATNLINAIQYICQKAASLDRPTAINMSLGGQEGPHDGTSLFEQALDQLGSAAGCILVASAGNSHCPRGDTPPCVLSIHTEDDLSNDVVGTPLQFQGEEEEGQELFGLQIEVWADPNSDLEVAIAARARGDSEVTDITDFYSLANNQSPANDSLTVNGIEIPFTFVTARDSQNNKIQTVVSVEPSSTDLDDVQIDLLVRGSGGFDAWIVGGGYFVPPAGVSITSGLDIYAVKSPTGGKEVEAPASAKNVVAVGAFTSKIDYIDVNGDERVAGDPQPTVGNIANFSSIGPSANPSQTGQKPNITAPGELVMSTLSSDAQMPEDEIGLDGIHAIQRGTSMSSPMVTGALVLLLQLDPTLTIGKIQELLAESADSDAMTGTVPNNTWGAGKLNVLNLLIAAFNEEEENGGGGSGGGCSLIRP